MLYAYICRQQDTQLEDIEAAVTRLGRVGLTIHEELASQGAMLDELGEDVDTTHSRLRATQKKVCDHAVLNSIQFKF
jgi:syntaxin of plants SYP6